MQSRQFTIKKKIWLLPFAMAVITLMVFSTCKRKKGNSDPTCVKLTKKQIQKWVDKGYTNPKDTNYMASVEFHTAYANPGDVFRVFAIGRNAKGDLMSKTLTELTPVDSCIKSHIHLKKYIFIGAVPATLDELEILDGINVKANLEYLRMLPYTEYEARSKFDMLAYTGFVHAKLTSKRLYRLALPPCPPCPNCKGPCPPPTSCPPGCVDDTIEQPIDSEANQ